MVGVTSGAFEFVGVGQAIVIHIDCSIYNIFFLSM